MHGLSPNGDTEFAALLRNVGDADELLRAIASATRLSILCLLAGRARSVGDIASCLDAHQSTVSQQLARLRADGFVEGRRAGKTVRYALVCQRTRDILELLDRQYRQRAAVAGRSAAKAGQGR